MVRPERIFEMRPATEQSWPQFPPISDPSERGIRLSTIDPIYGICLKL